MGYELEHPNMLISKILYFLKKKLPSKTWVLSLLQTIYIPKFLAGDGQIGSMA